MKSPGSRVFSNPHRVEWVTATEIKITLDRLNTFGDEVFGDEQVLRSYFYAIADVAVGARCKCNGHASECITSTVEGECANANIIQRGPDCNECLPFYNDAPWHRAAATNAHECKQCNCNGFSNRCFFDKELYEATGHGGHCLDCIANRDGPNCERCRENYHMREDGYCVACDCNSVGSRTLQCNSEGKCQCKPGVTGDKCDRCEANYYEFLTQGCKSCGCDEKGSVNNQPDCDSISGTCACKENVEGKQCNQCKPGFFNLDYENEFGCTPCFCYGHSSKCSSALGFSVYAIESTFAKSAEKWTAEDDYGRKIEVKYDGFSQTIAVQAEGDEVIYFLAPERFLGDQRMSYNQILEFTLRIGGNIPLPTATDIILEGNGISVTNTIFAQKNSLPTVQSQVYRFRLHEHSKYGWQPRLPSLSFISILTNLTAIKIKGIYEAKDVGSLDNIKLVTAARTAVGNPALWVEICDCPKGYLGQFCETCEPGYRHNPARGGPFKPCVPCNCNNHASLCDPNSGRCICQHNTTGENCELCARGFYGNALGGTPEDCQPCGCPNDGACIQVDEDAIVCTECPVEYTGPRCEICADGYFGDPNGRFGFTTRCASCQCNENIDLNAIGNCNTTTGECLKCIYNTGGPHCEICLPGYYGNALVLPKGDCKPCQCYYGGTVPDPSGALRCDQNTGVCSCKPHVVGRNCDQCEDGYYNLQSGEGCQSCNCDPIGSVNQTCNVYTGQCHCREGVTGLRCDRCQARMYGFSIDGCKPCDCDIIGTKDLQCDSSGQCPCLDNVEGRRCDRCKENKYDRQRGCVECPDCYNLVQDAARTHNSKLNRLTTLLNEIEQTPIVIPDDQFPDELSKLVTFTINSIAQQEHDIRQRTREISRTLSEIDENTFTINEKIQQTEVNTNNIDNIISEAEDKLYEIEININTRGKNALEEAYERSQIVGQQSENMTKIAQDARELADKLDSDADSIVAIAEEAKNKSIEAYDIVKTANNDQTHITDEVRRFRNELVLLENKLNQTSDWTEEVSNKTKAVKNEALNLFTDVKNLEVPRADLPTFKQRSVELKEAAYRLSNMSDNLFHDIDSLRNTIEEESDFGRQLLDKAYDQQDETDDLLNEIHLTKEATDHAIDSWNKVLNETENIYKYLKDFDTETQKSKEEAEKALKTIYDIDVIITDTQRKTFEAQQTLKEATDYANKASESERSGRKSAAEYLKQIEKEADALNFNSTRLTHEIDIAEEKIFETETAIADLSKISETNSSLMNEAKVKVGAAKIATDSVSKAVMDLLGDVNSIVNELQNSEDIDEDELVRLEQQLKVANNRIKEAKLDERLSQLQEEHKSQNNLIAQYKIDISRLHKDVENIQNIVEALPDGCFRRWEYVHNIIGTSHMMSILKNLYLLDIIG
ncbi:hypothetical protein NQ317_016734 [Molorchus minor]|uniref:Uncharacterized protein n=1 Tax=Molorchus minor TaxID=1323400 RepID=A0ABQ9J809_9CUCU|nr:hypothetical protein NQ317_016734 [Molorchus minor]